MIQIFNLYKVYPDNHPALTDINLHIKKGDFVFATGPSGAGKTTLIKLIFCAERATRGQIIVNGINLAKIKKSGISYLRRNIGVVFQDFKLLNNRTAYENIVFALEVTGARRKEIKRKAWQVLKLVGLQNRLDATPLGLSGGEQQRIAIARAIVNNPTILLADEPTGNLDSEITQDIMELFKNINERGTTVVIATHNKNLAHQYSDKHILLEKGRVINPA
ncbi:MAG: cell division ATP-binding protein FtsE [Deltaproteobacteria bacterium]|jgi:cell division transport system ATP-binding protein|nr:cell division ATP-binding protein FtsE [Deltaproteobacteria bacterium]NOQ86103.1 cell division ATP-binding protein FtsE [Deltaproteobacteria bacterium]